METRAMRSREVSTDSQPADTEWIKKQSKSHPDRYYYYNTNTGESRWDVPSKNNDKIVSPQKRKRNDSSTSTETVKSLRPRRLKNAVTPITKRKSRKQQDSSKEDYNHLSESERRIVLGMGSSTSSTSENMEEKASKRKPSERTTKIVKEAMETKTKSDSSKSRSEDQGTKKASPQNSSEIQDTKDNKTVSDKSQDSNLKTKSSNLQKGNVDSKDDGTKNSEPSVSDTDKSRKKLTAKRTVQKSESKLVQQSEKNKKLASKPTSELSDKEKSSNSDVGTSRVQEKRVLSEQAVGPDNKEKDSVPSAFSSIVVSKSTLGQVNSSAPSSQSSSDVLDLVGPSVNENNSNSNLNLSQQNSDASVIFVNDSFDANASVIFTKESFDPNASVIFMKSEDSKEEKTVPKEPLPYESLDCSLILLDPPTQSTQAGRNSDNQTKATQAFEQKTSSRTAPTQKVAPFMETQTEVPTTQQKQSRLDNYRIPHKAPVEQNTTLPTNRPVFSEAVPYVIDDDEEEESRDIEDMETDEDCIIIFSNLHEVRQQSRDLDTTPVGTLTQAVFNGPEISSPFKVKVEEESFHESKSLILVTDTNVLISCLNFLQNLLNSDLPDYGTPTLVMPWVVIQELDRIKDGRNRPNTLQLTIHRAVKAVHFIHGNLSAQNPYLVGQSPKEARETSDFIQIQCPDDRILVCCLQWKDKCPHDDVVLLTRDVNLRNKAMILGITAADNLTLWNVLKMKTVDLTKCQKPKGPVADITKEVNSRNNTRWSGQPASSQNVTASKPTAPPKSSVNRTIINLNSVAEKISNQRFPPPNTVSSVPTARIPPSSQLLVPQMRNQQQVRHPDLPSHDMVDAKLNAILKFVTGSKDSCHQVLNNTNRYHPEFVHCANMLCQMVPFFSTLYNQLDRCIKISPIRISDQRGDFLILTNVLNNFVAETNIPDPIVRQNLPPEVLMEYFRNTKNRPSLQVGIDQFGNLTRQLTNMHRQLPPTDS